MAAYDLEEQEQLSAIKAWWEKNGNIVGGIVLAVAVAVAGVQGWRWYDNKQAVEAGAIYGALAQAAEAKDGGKVAVLADELIKKHASTTAAALGVMQAAQTAIEAGDSKAARGRYEWLVASKADPLLIDLARLRLAALQLDAKEFDAALATLQAAPDAGFAARYADLRGDILFAQGKKDDARAAYRLALDAAKASDTRNPAFRGMLQTKLDALGGA
ncbi:YfgM family protein [Uliginosibacterium paludis]|uniref:Ancillary SecYEG translocon subunit n=1 Tax=Uliginosibacterium paludis TaxID=1615952 RepID=A0ABV2CRA8_9RHOO